MRNLVFQICISFITLFLTAINCNGDKNPAIIINENCYPGRAVVEEVVDEIMTCKMIAGQMMLKTSSTRYIPCNIDSLNLVLEIDYKISGKVYEIKPNERWAGTPFEITGIKN